MPRRLKYSQTVAIDGSSDRVERTKVGRLDIF